MTNTITEMKDEVEALDATLTEFKKVSDLSGASLDNYVKKAYAVGEAVAKTGDEIIQASTEFVKSGYSEEQSLELGKLASMFQNVADEEVAMSDAANFMISQMKTFDIEAKDAIRILDALNEAANNYAFSSADLSEGLTVSAAAMSAANNSYEETIALLGGITEITRNSNKAARGLITISNRLKGLSDEGEKDLEVASKIPRVYELIGTTLENTDGTLKSTYEILEIMAEKWETLTDTEREYILQTVGRSNSIK